MASCHLKLPRCEIPLSAEFNKVLDIKKQQLFKALITCQTWLYEPYFLSQITSPFSYLLAVHFPYEMASFVKLNAQ